MVRSGIEVEMVRGVEDVVRGVLRRYRSGEVSEREVSVVLYRCAQFLKVIDGVSGGKGSGRGLGLGSVREEVEGDG